MSVPHPFTLSGVARPSDAAWMLEEICEHFVEHAEVQRMADGALLRSEVGLASLRTDNGRLLIDLSAPTEMALQMSRTSLAEHMFYFAGKSPFALEWSEPPPPVAVPNLHHVTVVSAHDITPHMRRVIFACADVTPFIGGDMHVRLLVPPRGRTPVWPSFRPDGRVGWPEGEDALLVRAYTIRSVDAAHGEIAIDFLQHPAGGVPTPGADFARDAEPGTQVALMGPGSGRLPVAPSIFLAGDESALPAIARIAEEMPQGTEIRALIEVWDKAEEQALTSRGNLQLRWLHRKDYPAGASGVLGTEIRTALETVDPSTFVWVACEKQDVRAVRSVLKQSGHDRKLRYVAWYWEKGAAGGEGEDE